MSKFNYSIVKSLHYFFFQLQKVTVKINYYGIYKESTIFLIRLEFNIKSCFMDVPRTVLPKNRPLLYVEDLKSDEQKNT